ncbi:MAG TPA: T9SS type A sorting domain-containing protein [Ignavibacteriaceae bacterium]|nr:T9SS type A sorting domain-containing protein [Ignavibacteriaceae bacterium]
MFKKINRCSQTTSNRITVLAIQFLVILFLFNSILQATNVPEYVNLRQPNGYTFIARGEGDEFLQRFKTLNDYTIICSTNEWWYYANQGKDGKLYPTQYRVGVDDVEAMQCFVEDINYSQSIIDAAQTQRTNFLNSLTVKSVTPKSIGVILVDFPDRIATRIDPQFPNDVINTGVINNPNNSSWQKRYTMNDFQKLFFSENVYNTSSPDGTPVYGSINDYYKKVSYGSVYIYGAVLNQTDGNGKPIWYRASGNISTYSHSSLVEEAKTKAISAGFNPANYSSICVVFAGPWGGSANNLWPSSSSTTWIMGERNSAWDGDYGFASVGVHVHEYAHNLGLGDYRPGSQGCSPDYGNGPGGYLLMAYGNYGADINHHSRPVLMSAYEKIKLNYLTPEVITTNKIDYLLANIEDYNSAWKIVLNSSAPEEYFLIENKQPIGFDGGIPDGGLLITHYSTSGNWYQVGKNPIDIEEVGAISPTECGVTGNLYPLDFRCRPQSCWAQSNSQIEAGDFMNIPNQVFGPWSAPNSNRLNISTSSDIAIVFKSKSGSAIYADVFKTGAIEAPPSKPQNLQVTASTTNHPELTWEANTEPDKSYYKIYKFTTFEFGWQFLGTSTTPYYEDASERYCEPGQSCPQHTVRYRVTCMDTQNKESVPSDSVMTSVRGFAQEKIVVNPSIANLPSEYSLSANYPNPFNPTTIINFAVKDAGLVSLKVYDILGSEVVNETKEAGNFAVEFNAANLPSGVYIYTLQVNGFSSSRKMLLLK